MFLNGGAHGDARILSPVAVAEMTRNQIPGIGARFLLEFFPEASWGYGWSIDGAKRSHPGASLYSPRTYSHSGAGGVWMWVDPVYETVGIYLSVVLSRRPDGRMHRNSDLFQNAVMAAIVDVEG
jgi:CubicO group peptidase (beta-lactamase class C family)